jgi:tryptophanyl-tRNA synthetase
MARSAEVEQAIRRDPAGFRMLTGDRPTGPLHVGHYFGSLRNRVRLQRLGVELFVVIADYQVLTDRDIARALPARVDGLLMDYLAVGIDPDRATIFVHSEVEALNQLMLPLLSLVSVAELERNPTVKEEIAFSRQASVSGLMFTYPVHQAADILFCKANVVPVGKDQLPHVELTRVLARRFNERYGHGTAFFPAPDALIGETPLLLGTDGQKMSKSRGNSIPLSAGEDQTAALIRRTRTDSERVITYEPDRRPQISSLVLLAALCRGEPPEQIAAQIGSGGAARLKAVVIESLNEHLRPVRAARATYAGDSGEVRRILRRGIEQARDTAADTMQRVREAMGMDYAGAG